MKHFIPLIVAPFIWLTSCENKTISDQDPYFTSDAEEIFFKNIRQSDYKVEENQAAGMNIFTHQDSQETDKAVLKLIHNWRNDKAYVLLEWRVGRSDVLLRAAGETLQWTGETMDNHRDVAVFIYEHEIAGDSIFLSNGEAFTTSDAFMTTFRDFKKMTSKR
jgi:hypothetical protein